MYCVFIYTYELHVLLLVLVNMFPLSFSSKTPPFFVFILNCTCKGSSIPLDRGESGGSKGIASDKYNIGIALIP